MKLTVQNITFYQHSYFFNPVSSYFQFIVSLFIFKKSTQDISQQFFPYPYNINCSKQITMLIKKALQIQPQNCLKFISGKHSTTANITISINNPSDVGKFSFKLKTTNKPNYKVSTASGDIDQLVYQISIYLKDFSSLQDRLKDSFMITIFRNGEQGKNILPLERRFKVQIESENKSNRSDYSVPVIYQDDVSRVAASNYTTPSIVTTVDTLARNCCLPRRMYTQNVSVQMKKTGQKFIFNETKILETLNKSRRQLMDEKLKLKNLQDQIEIVKLKNRMRVFSAIGIFLLMLLIGWIIGNHFNTLQEIFVSPPPTKKWYEFF